MQVYQIDITSQNRWLKNYLVTYLKPTFHSLKIEIVHTFFDWKKITYIVFHEVMSMHITHENSMKQIALKNSKMGVQR